MTRAAFILSVALIWYGAGTFDWTIILCGLLTAVLLGIEGAWSEYRKYWRSDRAV